MTAGHVVARIGKPHGITGEVTVQLHTDDPGGRFADRARFLTDRGETLTLRSARPHRAVWLLGFAEVGDRTAAERLRGARLLLPADAETAGAEHSAAAEDAWYEEELVDLPVYSVEGDHLGTVIGLDLGVAQDRLVVALSAGGTAYVPFVRALVPVVDVPGRRIVIDPPDGLLDVSG